MATLKFLPIKTVASYSEHHGRQGNEGASQTFKDGNLIYPGGTNGAYIATPAGATAATAKNRIATTFGQNLATPTRRVEFVEPHIAPAVEITAGGAVSSLANTAVGLVYGYAIDATTGLGYMNLGDTANPVFRIEDSLLRGGAIGDTNVRMVVSVLPTAR